MEQSKDSPESSIRPRALPDCYLVNPVFGKVWNQLLATTLENKSFLGTQVEEPKTDVPRKEASDEIFIVPRNTCVGSSISLVGHELLADRCNFRHCNEQLSLELDFPVPHNIKQACKPYHDKDFYCPTHWHLFTYCCYQELHSFSLTMNSKGRVDDKINNENIKKKSLENYYTLNGIISNTSIYVAYRQCFEMAFCEFSYGSEYKMFVDHLMSTLYFCMLVRANIKDKLVNFLDGTFLANSKFGISPDSLDNILISEPDKTFTSGAIAVDSRRNVPMTVKIFKYKKRKMDPIGFWNKSVNNLFKNMVVDCKNRESNLLFVDGPRGSGDFMFLHSDSLGMKYFIEYATFATFLEKNERNQKNTKTIQVKGKSIQAHVLETVYCLEDRERCCGLFFVQNQSRTLFDRVPCNKNKNEGYPVCNTHASSWIKMEFYINTLLAEITTGREKMLKNVGIDMMDVQSCHVVMCSSSALQEKIVQLYRMINIFSYCHNSSPSKKEECLKELYQGFGCLTLLSIKAKERFRELSYRMQWNKLSTSVTHSINPILIIDEVSMLCYNHGDVKFINNHSYKCANREEEEINYVDMVANFNTWKDKLWQDYTHIATDDEREDMVLFLESLLDVAYKTNVKLNLLLKNDITFAEAIVRVKSENKKIRSDDCEMMYNEFGTYLINMMEELALAQHAIHKCDTTKPIGLITASPMKPSLFLQDYITAMNIIVGDLCKFRIACSLAYKEITHVTKELRDMKDDETEKVQEAINKAYDAVCKVNQDLSKEKTETLDKDIFCCLKNVIKEYKERVTAEITEIHGTGRQDTILLLCWNLIQMLFLNLSTTLDHLAIGNNCSTELLAACGYIDANVAFDNALVKIKKMGKGNYVTDTSSETSSILSETDSNSSSYQSSSDSDTLASKSKRRKKKKRGGNKSRRF